MKLRQFSRLNTRVQRVCLSERIGDILYRVRGIEPRTGLRLLERRALQFWRCHRRTSLLLLARRCEAENPGNHAKIHSKKYNHHNDQKSEMAFDNRLALSRIGYMRYFRFCIFDDVTVEMPHVRRELPYVSSQNFCVSRNIAFSHIEGHCGAPFRESVLFAPI